MVEEEEDEVDKGEDVEVEEKEEEQQQQQQQQEIRRKEGYNNKEKRGRMGDERRDVRRRKFPMCECIGH